MKDKNVPDNVENSKNEKGVKMTPIKYFKELKYHTNQDEIRIEGEREEKRARRRLRTDFLPPPLRFA